MTNSKLVHEAFEECLELVFHGESIEDCLRRFPAQAEGLRPLLETAVAARKAVEVQPRPEFRERARQQLLAAQRDRAVQAAGRRTGFAWNWRPAWAWSLAAFLVVMVAGGGAVAASAGSMPGQPLYAVKHASEGVRLALTLSATAKIDLYARLADQRVGEIVYLAGKSEAGRLPQATQDLDRYLTRITELSGGVSQDAVLVSKNSGAAAPAATVPSERAGATPTMAPSYGALPPAPTTASPGQAAGPVGTAAAADHSGEATSARSELKARMSAQSVQDAAQLKAALAGATPATEPALLHAIAVSQSGYEKVLQALQDQP
jgi:hypothetical protein